MKKLGKQWHGMGFVKFGASILLCICLAPSPSWGKTAPASTQPAKNWAIRWEPTSLVNGAPVVFHIVPPTPLNQLSGSFLGHSISFSLDAGSKSWYGLAGVSLETKPGTYTLQLHGTSTAKNGVAKTVEFDRSITVKNAKYPSIAIQVSKQFTQPSEEQLRQVREDKKVKEDVFTPKDTAREWHGDFEAPVHARISDVFGTRRTFNGETRSTHQGLDFAVPTGTPIAAPNAGTVLLARPLFFEGNFIVLDHGQGLLTLYLHLSEFKVKEGDHVTRGQEIGLSGGTGRASGPHLHLAVRWQGVYLDPAALLKLNLP